MLVYNTIFLLPRSCGCSASIFACLIVNNAFSSLFPFFLLISHQLFPRSCERTFVCLTVNNAFSSSPDHVDVQHLPGGSRHPSPTLHGLQDRRGGEHHLALPLCPGQLQGSVHRQLGEDANSWKYELVKLRDLSA